MKMQQYLYNGHMEALQEPVSPPLLPLASALNPSDREFLESMAAKHRITHQQMRILIEQAIDLSIWNQGPIASLWDEDAGSGKQGKARLKAIIGDLMEKISVLRREPTEYRDFHAKPTLSTKITHVETLQDNKLLGRCPCPVSGEKTRCCNLLTLDAVQQCAFACSYCSIQSFYHKNEIVFTGNLASRLEHLELPEATWHIGTGQSSDSLMWGNEHGILDALAGFARSHPSIVVELKTKSGRTDWIHKVKFPRNMIATWSLNAPTIIAKEEHKSASLEARLAAARKAADAGILVGFHLHPMVHFSGWQHEYRKVVETITNMFGKEEVVMVSFGTLTFTKEVLRQLRQSGRPSRILQMELVESAGKYSYPEEVKRNLFSHAYNCFPVEWKTMGGPFFYLCMELPQLWEPVLGRSYSDNASFEADMKAHYLRKVGIDLIDVDIRYTNDDN
jgi:spore photoproduct lyase